MVIETIESYFNNGTLRYRYHIYSDMKRELRILHGFGEFYGVDGIDKERGFYKHNVEIGLTLTTDELWE